MSKKPTVAAMSENFETLSNFSTTPQNAKDSTNLSPSYKWWVTPSHLVIAFKENFQPFQKSPKIDLRHPERSEPNMSMTEV